MWQASWQFNYKMKKMFGEKYMEGSNWFSMRFCEVRLQRQQPLNNRVRAQENTLIQDDYADGPDRDVE